MELKTSTKQRGQMLGWPEDLLTRIEASALKDETVSNMAYMKLPAERVSTFVEKVEANPEMMGRVTFGFIRTKSERGVRATPGPDGMTLDRINIGSYGQVPDTWPYDNDAPRGSHPNLENYLPGSYTIFDKAEVWAEGVDVLYEDAIKDRWIPATDLDWANGLKELPEEVERAMCQLCTTYSSHGLVEQKIISKWFEPISYGYHDVMLFLGTQVYDAGHKVEALRKRALANGGGLGQAPLGTLYRGFYGALKLTEMLVALDVVYKSYELTMFEANRDYAKTDLDAKLFDYLAKDSRRHLEYGKRHLLWYIQHHPRGIQNATAWLGRAEAALSNELRHSHADREALVVLYADGLEKISVGVEQLRKLREKQMHDYIALLDELGIDRLPALNPGLSKLTEDPLFVN